MKTILILLSLATGLLAAEPGPLSPLDVLKRDGVLVLSDGSSYFAFFDGGTFESVPVGESGRTLRGTWTSNGDREIPTITAIAKKSWMNGLTAEPPEYCRVVFRVYAGGQTSPPEIFFSPLKIKAVYRGYYLIEEFTTIPKPK